MSATGHAPLSESIWPVLTLFERLDKAVLTPKHISLDRYGRLYPIGKREERMARIWMIPSECSESPPYPLTSLPHSERGLSIQVFSRHIVYTVLKKPGYMEAWRKLEY